MARECFINEFEQKRDKDTKKPVLNTMMAFSTFFSIFKTTNEKTKNCGYILFDMVSESGNISRPTFVSLFQHADMIYYKTEDVTPQMIFTVAYLTLDTQGGIPKKDLLDIIKKIKSNENSSKIPLLKEAISTQTATTKIVDLDMFLSIFNTAFNINGSSSTFLKKIEYINIAKTFHETVGYKDSKKLYFNAACEMLGKVYPISKECRTYLSDLIEVVKEKENITVSNIITISQQIEYYRTKMGEITPETFLVGVFRVIDKNCDGTLDKTEITKYIKDVTPKKCEPREELVTMKEAVQEGPLNLEQFLLLSGTLKSVVAMIKAKLNHKKKPKKNAEEEKKFKDDIEQEKMEMEIKLKLKEEREANGEDTGDEEEDAKTIKRMAEEEIKKKTGHTPRVMKTVNEISKADSPVTAVIQPVETKPEMKSINKPSNKVETNSLERSQLFQSQVRTPQKPNSTKNTRSKLGESRGGQAKAKAASIKGSSVDVKDRHINKSSPIVSLQEFEDTIDTSFKSLDEYERGIFTMCYAVGNIDLGEGITREMNDYIITTLSANAFYKTVKEIDDTYPLVYKMLTHMGKKGVNAADLYQLVDILGLVYHENVDSSSEDRKVNGDDDQLDYIYETYTEEHAEETVTFYDHDRDGYLNEDEFINSIYDEYPIIEDDDPEIKEMKLKRYAYKVLRRENKDRTLFTFNSDRFVDSMFGVMDDCTTLENDLDENTFIFLFKIKAENDVIEPNVFMELVELVADSVIYTKDKQKVFAPEKLLQTLFEWYVPKEQVLMPISTFDSILNHFGGSVYDEQFSNVLTKIENPSMLSSRDFTQIIMDVLIAGTD
ncbi:hypothetical protein EIN_168640 [Entamoeba invadens IP1]|uniref:EF-hand domain-containing protein n=1 Tax=Entamoeba invadens IP1 TaxID=370355 RepID=A0A0A1TVJ9_ENTIV|nr:hypothetical protein EIN_168640 [Entamoeba invadens IP1]ELP84469.1 hypothetical protein EIN_168640 [Entamoeba invadens IP1]|eukprot:XP_004183815.1 hypothetical protein EIN_168640 [Entamoeba invadens IP1]